MLCAADIVLLYLGLCVVVTLCVFMNFWTMCQLLRWTRLLPTRIPNSPYNFTRKQWLNFTRKQWLWLACHHGVVKMQGTSFVLLYRNMKWEWSLVKRHPRKYERPGQGVWHSRTLTGNGRQPSIHPRSQLLWITH